MSDDLDDEDVPDWAYCGECGVSHLHRSPECPEELEGFLAGDFAADSDFLIDLLGL